jgi:hypothetical protein
VWKRGARIDRDAYRTDAASERATAASKQTAAGGMVSNFDDGQPSARFGAGWSASTDQMLGGKSRAELAVVEPGARGSKGALRVSGEVAPGKPDSIWAGALFSPGARVMAPVDMSSSKGLVFWARGDGKPYQILLFTQSRGYTPVARPFSAGKEWKEVRLELADFDGIDGRDLMGVFVGAVTAGRFSFEIDEVTFTR